MFETPLHPDTSNYRDSTYQWYRCLFKTDCLRHRCWTPVPSSVVDTPGSRGAEDGDRGASSGVDVAVAADGEHQVVAPMRVVVDLPPTRVTGEAPLRLPKT